MSSEDREYTTPYLRIIPLAKRVLVVATPGGQGSDWAAYVDAVPGKNHNEEWASVADHGCKLDYRLAAHMFPEFDPETYRL